jgi:membrane protein
MTERRGSADMETSGGIWSRMRVLLRDVVETLQAARVPSLAAQVAYSLIFAMPSILLMVMAVAGQIDQRTGFAITREVRRAIVRTLPADVEQVMTGLLDDATARASAGPTTLSAILSILIALLMAGNGLGELSAACCTASGVEDTRSPWVRRVIFTVSSIAIAIVLIASFALFVWGGALVGAAGGWFGAADEWVGVWDWLQLPALLVFVFFGITLLYMTGTGHYVFWHVAPGALSATVLWLLAVKGFQVYLEVARPGTAYGAASGVLVFLVYLYVNALVLIVGGMIAAVIAREVREGTLLGRFSSFQPATSDPATRVTLESSGRGHG